PTSASKRAAEKVSRARVMAASNAGSGRSRLTRPGRSGAYPSLEDGAMISNRDGKAAQNLRAGDKANAPRLGVQVLQGAPPELATAGWFPDRVKMAALPRWDSSGTERNGNVIG